MPRYHFQVFEGRDVPDEEGTELANLQAAHHQALHFIGELFIYEAERLTLNRGCSVVVEDGYGHVHLKVKIDIELNASHPFPFDAKIR